LSFLIDHLAPPFEPLLQAAAARTVSAYALGDAQLIRLAGALGQASPLVAPLLAPAFTRNPRTSLAVARVFLEALARSPGSSSLSVADLKTWLAGAPAEARSLALPLLESLAARREEQAGYLKLLADELGKTTGDRRRGQEIFFSRKVGCYGCHRASGGGGHIGPDLSQIGRLRSPRDLLESIVFPSSSVVPEYRSYVVATRDGRLIQAMIVYEDNEAIDLRSSDLAELRVARKQIEEIRPAASSIMPEGLEKSMSRQELADLIEFLARRK
jgi:putative heme-binding domain-containing protein